MLCPYIATGISGGAIGSITFGGGRYVAIAVASTNRVAWTNDLVGTWTAPAANATGGTGAIMSSSAYGKVNGVDTWVIVGRVGDGVAQIRVTTDFITFINNASETEDEPPVKIITGAPAVQLNSVAYGNGRFVAVGNTATVIHSTDGRTWTPAATAFSGDQNNVVFTNGYFVASGASGSVRYSADGITWTAANVPTGSPAAINAHVRIANFGNNMWHAGGRGANLWYAEVAP